MDKQDKTAPEHTTDQVEAVGEASPPSAAPRLDLPIDEHEEEVSENGRTVRRQGIYLLPNLFTTGALFAGFYAVIAAMRGDFESASIAIFAALVLDGLDGRVARLTNTSSKFGAEYDSLSDMVSFGVAPALVMFSWALGDLGKFGWSAAFIYVACAALRLARFNTQIDTADKNYFTGLASPAAASVVAGTVWVCNDLGLVGADLPFELSVVVGVLTATVGFLMVANFQYYSFKRIDFRGRVPFVVMIAVVLVFGLITVDPPLILLAGFLTYAVSGPVMQVIKRRKKGAS
jgi:CDP-diacylglycerol--serine O-phosphatidyltransferase